MNPTRISDRTGPNLPCGSCHTNIEWHAVDHVHNAPQFDDILVCGNCGTVNKMGLLDPIVMTQEEINSLHKDEQRDLDFAVRNIRARLKSQLNVHTIRLIPPGTIV